MNAINNKRRSYMISVFTATYNRANELRNLYESLKKQAYKRLLSG